MQISCENIEISILKESGTLKQLKQLCRKTTGEQLKIFDGDKMVIAKHNKKIIGLCCIASKSPERHFPNEETFDVPYLYNYMCDLSHKSKKASLAIMNFIKELHSEGVQVDALQSSEVSENSKKSPKYINLDVMKDNTHAQQFFEKNGFKKNGVYTQRINEYIMYTYAEMPF